MTKMRNIMRLLIQTPSTSTCIQCMIPSHHKKQDFSLTLPILNIQVQKEKGKRCPSTVPHPMHSSSLNISNLNFPCGAITRAFNLQSTSKAYLVL